MCILPNGTTIVTSNAVNTTCVHFVKKKKTVCKYSNVIYNVKMYKYV